MSDKAKRSLSLVMVVLGVITLIGLVFSGQHATWQYVAAPVWIIFFATLYRNLRTKKGGAAV